MTTYTAYLIGCTWDWTIPGPFEEPTDICPCMYRSGVIVLELYAAVRGGFLIRSDPSLKLNAIYVGANATRLKLVDQKAGTRWRTKYTDHRDFKSIRYHASTKSLYDYELNVPSMTNSSTPLPDITLSTSRCLMCTPYIDDYQFDDVLEIGSHCLYRHDVWLFPQDDFNRAIIEYDEPSHVLFEYEMVTSI